MSKSEMNRLAAQMSDKDRADRLAARCASQMDKIAEQDKRIKELEGALRSLLSALSNDDDEGLIEHADAVIYARRILK